MSIVNILIPIYKKEVEWFEKISFEQCLRVLNTHPISIVTFKGLDINYFENLLKSYSINYTIVYFNECYFKSIKGYNQLLLSKIFYKEFKVYEYILIYQLDVFVFRDELISWCRMKYSYIGAPWVEWKDGRRIITGVGNGGLSLRNTKDHLKAITSFAYIKSPKSIIKKHLLIKQSLFSFLKALFRVFINLTLKNNTYYRFNNYPYNEDLFWGNTIGYKYKWFKKPSVENACLFSLELEPQYLFNLYNKNHLPFGCHAWQRYDIKFWQPFIEEAGYTLPDFVDVPS